MPLSGEFILASDAIPDVWTAWTPVWSSTGTQPVLGNGTISGTYIEAGKLIIVRGFLQIGSTTTVGTGTYQMSVPVSLDTSPNAQVPHPIAWFRDVSTALDYSYFALIGAGVTQFRGTGQGTNVQWAAAVPAAPATGDWFAWTYTAAAA